MEEDKIRKLCLFDLVLDDSKNDEDRQFCDKTISIFIKQNKIVIACHKNSDAIEFEVSSDTKYLSLIRRIVMDVTINNKLTALLSKQKGYSAEISALAQAREQLYSRYRSACGLIEADTFGDYRFLLLWPLVNCSCWSRDQIIQSCL